MLTLESETGPLTLAEFGVSLTALAHCEALPFLAVAVSGGPDSLALALLADRWSRQRGGEISALTVDHRLRPESGAEIGQVNGWLTARAIRHEVLTWSGHKPTTGIQEAARIARYRLLADWCREHGCLHLLTAHHREDQIETHLIRRRAQSGPDGLAGMSAIRELEDCRILRPLLGTPRARLRALLEAERQPFLSDPSNLDSAFERSHFRVGDGATSRAADFSALVSTVRTFGHSRAARQREMDTHLARLVELHPAGFGVLDLDTLMGMPREMAERALSAVVGVIGGAVYPARRERIGRLCDALGTASRRGYTLGGCRFVRWRGRVLVVRELAIAAQPIRIEPGTRLYWDRRYDVRLPQTASKSLTIGYLGSGGVIQQKGLPALLNRARLPQLLFPVLPAAWDEGGLAAVPHLGYTREGIAGLPQFIFRPVNQLTQAGFTVV